MIQIPETTKWRQPNDSDKSGELWASFNLDLTENEGSLRLSKRLLLNTGTADIAQITGAPARILRTGSLIKFIAGTAGGTAGSVFYGDSTVFGTYTRDATSNAPTKIDSTLDDAVYANAALYVVSRSTANNAVMSFYKKIGDLTWAETTLDVSLQTGLTVSLATSGISGANRVYCATQESRVISWSTADSVSLTGNYTLDLTPGYLDSNKHITKILVGSNRLWILTANLIGGRGHVYEWDGYSSNYQNEYELESSGALAGVIHNDIPYIMDTNGNLCAWNGGSFKVLTGFNRENNKFLYKPQSATNDRFIHPNGMTVIDNQIHMLINNQNYDNGGTIEETIPSGIWKYDEAKGLVHAYSVSQYKSSDTLKDFGAVRIASAGALTEMVLPSTSASDDGTFLAGFGYYTDATTAKYGIFYENNIDTLAKAGYLVTRKISSVGSGGVGAIKNNWQKIYTLYRKFLTSNDIIEVKYRTIDAPPVEATITWTSTTTFTTTTDVSSYWTSGTGGEVEVLQGIGAGRCSHLTSVVYNAGTYTCTVDQTYTGATGTAKARFQSWKKIKTINTQLDTSDETIINNVSNWIQFKVWMSWTGKNEIEKLVIINENSYPAK
ncbi:MAG: hypothetical protein EBR82_14370 [Caulobacteraceae bacterium]|nr:hypothetical protein [Caulobacteraceae bacterium]